MKSNKTELNNIVKAAIIVTVVFLSIYALSEWNNTSLTELSAKVAYEQGQVEILHYVMELKDQINEEMGIDNEINEQANNTYHGLYTRFYDYFKIYPYCINEEYEHAEIAMRDLNLDDYSKRNCTKYYTNQDLKMNCIEFGMNLKECQTKIGERKEAIELVDEKKPKNGIINSNHRRHDDTGSE